MNFDVEMKERVHDIEARLQANVYVRCSCLRFIICLAAQMKH